MWVCGSIWKERVEHCKYGTLIIRLLEDRDTLKQFNFWFFLSSIETYGNTTRGYEMWLASTTIMEAQGAERDMRFKSLRFNYAVVMQWTTIRWQALHLFNLSFRLIAWKWADHTVSEREHDTSTQIILHLSLHLEIFIFKTMTS